MRGPLRRCALEALLALALFGLALVLFSLVRERGFEQRLNSDEPEWIAISVLHWRQLVHGEPPAGAELATDRAPSADPWQQGVQSTTFGFMNPCLPKLAWGAVLAAAGHRDASPYAFQIFAREAPEKAEPARAELLPAMPLARRVVLVFAAAGAVLLFFAAREMFAERIGWLAGALAYALWFASPLVRGTASYLRTDHFMLPFCLGALLVALRRRDALAGRQGARALHATALGLGLLCGLSVASKLNGALACVAVALWIPLAWLAAGEARRVSFARGPLLALALAGATTIAVFWALNPVLWSDPIEGVRAILARWDKLLLYFQDELAPRTGVEVARTLPERMSMFLRNTLVRDEPLHALTGLPIGAALLALGLVLLVLRAVRRSGASDDGRERALILAVFVIVFSIGTALWLPLDWERFYLTAVPCVVLLEAWLVASGIDAFVARRRRASPTAAAT